MTIRILKFLVHTPGTHIAKIFQRGGSRCVKVRLLARLSCCFMSPVVGHLLDKAIPKGGESHIHPRDSPQLYCMPLQSSDYQFSNPHQIFDYEHVWLCMTLKRRNKMVVTATNHVMFIVHLFTSGVSSNINFMNWLKCSWHSLKEKEHFIQMKFMATLPNN